MGVLKVGEKDRSGRQKRVEHSGKYLRASRTGGVSLRAHTRAAGVNLTGNTRQGVRVSTRLARNTQVAFQNGRFILRGRYGSDAAKLNLSKSGVTVSSKTPVGSFNWVKPGRSSFKMGGVQVRGHKAAQLQGIYLLFTGVFALLGGLLKAFGMLFVGIARGVGAIAAWRDRARQERERLEVTATEVAPIGAQLLQANDVSLAQEPARDLFAGLLFTLTALGRGSTRFDTNTVDDPLISPGVQHGLTEDVTVVGRQLVHWLGTDEPGEAPQAVLGLLHELAVAFQGKVSEETRAEALLALDDACLAGGPRTVLQEAMIDLLAEVWTVDLVLEGEQ